MAEVSGLAGRERTAVSAPIDPRMAGRMAHTALINFGSPTVQLATMHPMLVEQKRWLPERRFLNALNITLPSPEFFDDDDPGLILSGSGMDDQSVADPRHVTFVRFGQQGAGPVQMPCCCVCRVPRPGG
jgi:hypothetical protein